MIGCLTTETVKGAALSLQGVDDVKSSDGLAASVLGVGNSVTDDVLQEHLQDTTGLFVDKTRDALDTTSASQTADRRLGDTLDVITQDLSVALSTTLSKSLSSLSSAGHFELVSWYKLKEQFSCADCKQRDLFRRGQV